ncbi:MAG: hypothetical protein ACK5HO_07880, partial [Pseudomonadota bacterium]
LARLLLDITIGCCFDSHPRIDSVLQNSGFRYGLLENAIVMSINSLERIINTTLLTKISKVSSSGSSSSSSSADELSGQAIYNSLRSGAKSFAASMQQLNASATFVNLSLDTTEKLLGMVTQLEALALKANRGNISSSTAKKLRADFETIADSFDKVIEGVVEGEQDLFDVDLLQTTLANAGLDSEKVTELARALKRFTHPAEPTVGSDGEVIADGNPVPLAEFQRALRLAIVDPDDPSDDRSGFFGKVRNELKDIRINLEGNVKALKETAGLIGDNITLVRAAGFAFLDVSNEMTGTESPEVIAEQLRQRIRSAARPFLAQAHNLEPIMVAGLAILKDSEENK